MKRRASLAAVCAACAAQAVTAGAASAEGLFDAVTLELEHWAAVSLEDGDLALARTTLSPQARFALGADWRLEAELRLELADDEVGLGARDGYSPASRPLINAPDARLEIDRLALVYRRGATSVTLGKQTVPWGVLDGLRVTDRFDAVRYRDFLLTETRPDRLSRWGVRARTRLGATSVDLAAALDPTVAQLAEPGAAFDVAAPRSRGGLPRGLDAAELRVSPRDRYLEDATVGVRLSRTLGPLDVSALALSGPEVEPVLRLEGHSAQGPIVALDYPRRTLIGASVEGAAGDTVLRFEAALIPDQPVNVVDEAAPLAPEPLAVEDRPRVLAGVGVDWDAPADLFVNAQLGIDHVWADERPLARPQTDVIATLRLRRAFSNDTVIAQGELIGSLSDDDGVVRPSVEWRLNDTVTLAAGVDVVFGDRDGLFGQFEDASRAWVRLRATF